jgi:hypothetical protein
VCGSFWRVDKIQNGGRCHGNQGAKIVKLVETLVVTSNLTVVGYYII